MRWQLVSSIPILVPKSDLTGLSEESSNLYFLSPSGKTLAKRTVQLLVDDCREIEDLRLLLVDLLPDQANDVTVQHRLRECLQEHRPARDEFGVRVPVIAAVREKNQVRYVRLGHQFCVRDAKAAVISLKDRNFNASCSERLLV